MHRMRPRQQRHPPLSSDWGCLLSTAAVPRYLPTPLSCILFPLSNSFAVEDTQGSVVPVASHFPHPPYAGPSLSLGVCMHSRGASMVTFNARLVSVIAATVIALACGTNYIYSAWGPQFAHRLKLSSTQSNLIGTCGNLGMYASGIPTGMLVDHKGPRWGVALGALLFAAGYYPIAQAFEAGPGKYSVAILCMFSFFSGSGSASAFTAAIKAAALNYPESRGSATAFPLAAFGLSAFFFSVVSTLAFSNNTYAFLMVLASGTVALPILSFPFLKVLPAPTKHQHEQQVLQRRSSQSPDRLTSTTPGGALKEPRTSTGDEYRDDSENASLLSTASRFVVPDENHESPHLDVRGFALIPHPEFWQLFSMLGLLTGIGLMTINNIGNDAQALWKHYDASTDPEFIQQRQVMHVAILSLGSFTGRLASGIGSDFLVSKLGRSRFWCLFISAVIFCVAQFLATVIQDPHLLVLVSGLTGLAYGFLFGVYPSIVAHTFGVHGLSQNWGTMTLAPVISGNIFNILYGRIYDSHSIVQPNGDRECLKGKSCYSAAYVVTFVSAIGGIGLCLWSIWHENEVHKKMERESKKGDHERIA